MFLYTTCSHAPEQHRFRIVFALPRTITDPREMAAATRSLALKLNGDLAATDATRICFGSSNAQVWMLGREISPSLLDELIAQGIQPPQSDRADGTTAIASSRSALSVELIGRSPRRRHYRAVLRPSSQDQNLLSVPSRQASQRLHRHQQAGHRGDPLFRVRQHLLAAGIRQMTSTSSRSSET